MYLCMMKLCSISRCFAMSQYTTKHILNALLITPLIPQLLLSILFISSNRAYDLDSLIVVVVFNTVIYIAFCSVILPIAYAISIFLARKNNLNLITIVLGAILMWLIVTIIGYLIFTQSLPHPLWTLFSDWYFYLIGIFAGCCYWGILKWLSLPSKKLIQE